MKVVLLSQSWENETSSMYTYARDLIGALHTAGVDAVATQGRDRINTRIGGVVVPLVRRALLSHRRSGIDVIHDISTGGLVYRGTDVSTIHDAYLYNPRFTSRDDGLWVRRRVYRNTLPITVRRVKAVIVTTEAMKQEVASYIPAARDKLRVVPIPHVPVDARRLKPLYDALWVGRFSPRKRPMDYVDCAYRNPDLTFAFRWSPSPIWTPSAKEQQYFDDCKNLVQIPPLSEAGLDRLYRQSRAVVSTSDYEGWHVPPIEGYVRGCRVVLPKHEPYTSIFPPNAPHHFDPSMVWSMDAALRAALADTSPRVPDPAFVRALSFENVGKLLRAVYEEATR